MADLTLFRARHPNKSHYSLVSSTQGLDSYRKETKEALRDPKQQCRLCHLSSASASASASAAAGHDRNNRLLIVPCRCPQALHVQCLNELRNTSEEAKLTCLDCGFEYLFHPETRLSAWDHTRFISKVCFDISVAMAILQSVILSLMMLLMYLFSRGVDVFAMFSTLYDTDSDVVEARLIEEVRQSMVNINFNVNTTSSSSASSMNNMLDARMDGLEDLATPTFWYFYGCSFFFLCAIFGLLAVCGCVERPTNNNNNNNNNRRGCCRYMRPGRGLCGDCCCNGPNDCNCNGNGTNCDGDGAAGCLVVVVVILAISGFVYGIMIGIDLIWSVLTEHYAKLQRKRFAKTHVVMDVQNLDRIVIRYLDPYLIPDLSKIVCEYMYG